MQHRRALSIVIALAIAVGVGVFSTSLTRGTKGEQPLWKPTAFTVSHTDVPPLKVVAAARSYQSSLALSHLQSLYATVLTQEAAARAAAAARYASEKRSGSTSPTASTPPTPESSSGVNGIPSAWWPTAKCEEQGEDNPYAGYFGILEWQGFDGYPTAGSAPLSVQLAWEAAHGQGPPDAPGECHSY